MNGERIRRFGRSAELCTLGAQCWELEVAGGRNEETLHIDRVTGATSRLDPVELALAIVPLVHLILERRYKFRLEEGLIGW